MITSRPDGERAVADGATTDLRLLAYACVAWVGATLSLSFTGAWPVLATGLFGVTVALLTREKRGRLALGLASLFLVASYLGARADRNYVPVEAGPFDGEVTVIGDPERSGAGWIVEFRLAGRERVRARAYGRAGSVVADAAIGESLTVVGRLSPVVDQPWLRTRHIVGHLAIDEAEPLGPAGLLHLVPTGLRDRITAGAATMPDRRRALYLGLVMGDDRLQPLGQKLQFNAAGLTHLLAVSGQNVAFVLVVARPLLQAFGYRGRFVGLVVVLVLFAIITRLEPSVLRATVTAGITAWATLTGRERTGITVLGLAVIALIGIDPFLVNSVGFQLSVAASAAILLVGPALERRLPGPPWLVAPLAITVAAQVGVSPLLILYFGPVSAASIPANVLVGWAAAAVMTLGLTVGIVAGLVPEPIADLLQQPTEILLWWIDWVAAWQAGLPAPRYGLLNLATVIVALALIRTIDRPLLRAVPVLVIIVASVVAIPGAPTEMVECGRGITWHPGGAGSASVLVLTPEAYDSSVAACFEAGIRSADVLVLERGSAGSARLATALAEVVDLGVILAPPQHRVIGARRQLDALEIYTAQATLEVRPTTDGARLDIVYCCND